MSWFIFTFLPAFAMALGFICYWLVSIRGQPSRQRAGCGARSPAAPCAMAPCPVPFLALCPATKNLDSDCDSLFCSTSMTPARSLISQQFEEDGFQLCILRLAGTAGVV